MTQMKLPIEQITGFLDADGSFEAKVYSGNQKPVSFHVNIIFSQKDSDVLQAVIDSIGPTNVKGSSSKVVSKRNITNPSGTQSIGRSTSFAFSSIGGQTLLKEWATNPPKAPTKYNDYKIALILAEVSKSQTSSALDVVKKHLNPKSTLVPQDELTAGLALLWLRYRMFGKVKSNRNPNLKPIEHYYKKTRATQKQISESVTIGQELFDPIQQAVRAHTADLLKPRSRAVNISEDYLLGYHMGDGSFQIQTSFGKKNQTFKATFKWTLTDCAANKPLLEAIANHLSKNGVRNIKVSPGRTWHRLTLSNKNGCLKMVQLWKGKPLLSARQNQYNCFEKALNLYDLASFRANLVKAEEFINLKWSMNPGTNNKKAGSLNEDLTKIRSWFDNS